jgi:hypothetical protein
LYNRCYLLFLFVIFHRCLSIYEKSFGSSSPQAALVLNDLAILLFRNQRHRKALGTIRSDTYLFKETYQKAVAMYEKVFGRNHPEVGKN